MKRISQWIATVFLIVLAGIFITNLIQQNDQSQFSDTQDSLKIGMTAPDFELKTLAGDTVKLSDYRGKKVFLNFWATWCGPCKEEMPAMESFYQSHQEDVVILAINALNTEIEGEKKVEDFVEEHQLTFPIVLDENGETLESYHVTHMPTTYFIGADGTIKELPHRGPMDETFMKEMKNIMN